MKCDIIIDGVGGQGVLSVAAVIAAAARKAGLQAVQSEVHGMSQRGGAVIAHLRLSDRPIHSGTIGHGQADLIISMEPMEGLRYVDYLSPTGTLLAASEPVVNIPDYPELEQVHAHVREVEGSLLIDALALAKQAGAAKAANVVMVGAAMHLLPLRPEHVEQVIREAFGRKGDRIVQANLDAFALGREAALQPA